MSVCTLLSHLIGLMEGGWLNVSDKVVHGESDKCAFSYNPDLLLINKLFLILRVHNVIYFYFST